MGVEAQRLRLLSFNVNGLRRILKEKRASLVNFLDSLNADVVCMQETKLSQKDAQQMDFAIAEGWWSSSFPPPQANATLVTPTSHKSTSYLFPFPVTGTRSSVSAPTARPILAWPPFARRRPRSPWRPRRAWPARCRSLAAMQAMRLGPRGYTSRHPTHSGAGGCMQMTTTHWIGIRTERGGTGWRQLFGQGL